MRKRARWRDVDSEVEVYRQAVHSDKGLDPHLTSVDEHLGGLEGDGPRS